MSNQRHHPRLIALAALATALATLVAVVSVGVGGRDGFLSALAGTLAGGAASGVAVVVTVIRDRWTGSADGNERHGAGATVVRQAGRMLPSTVRGTYVEEWRAWLWDLREQREPWYRRLGEVLSIVFIAVPRLAVILRLGSQKAVD